MREHIVPSAPNVSQRIREARSNVQIGLVLQPSVAGRTVREESSLQAERTRAGTNVPFLRRVVARCPPHLHALLVGEQVLDARDLRNRKPVVRRLRIAFVIAVRTSLCSATDHRGEHRRTGSGASIVASTPDDGRPVEIDRHSGTQRRTGVDVTTRSGIVARAHGDLQQTTLRWKVLSIGIVDPAIAPVAQSTGNVVASALTRASCRSHNVVRLIDSRLRRPVSRRVSGQGFGAPRRVQ